MIKRIWHGWTTPGNADAYEKLLQEEIFPGIAAKSAGGFLGAELLRSDGDGETEFVTLMTFDSLDTIRRLAGDDVTLAYIPPAGRKLLSRCDERARHYEIRVTAPGE